MNRKEEWEALHRELEQTPPELAFVATRLKARAKRGRTLRFLGVPAASLAGVFTAFVLLVNVSLPFALACVNTPFLRELMAAVAVTPSLKAMMENDFIQPLELTAEQGGAKMTIYYVAYDGSEVHLFYTASWNGSDRVEVLPAYYGADGEPMQEITYSSGMPPEKGELGHLRLHFCAGETPERLHMKVGFLPIEEIPDGAPIAGDDAIDEWENPDDWSKEKPVAELEFDLHFDPQFIRAKKVFTPRTDLEVDGQTITLERVTIYPTGTELEFSDHPENTAWLKGLELWLEDGRGNRYEARKSGVVSSGGAGQFVPVYWLESFYFEEGDVLTLCISDGKWLDKEWETATLDLAEPAGSRLPEGISLDLVERNDGDVKLSFTTQTGSSMSNVYTAPDGTVGYTNVWGVAEQEDGRAEEYTYLWDYPWDTVEMGLNYTRITHRDTPLRIPLT